MVCCNLTCPSTPVSCSPLSCCPALGMPNPFFLLCSHFMFYLLPLFEEEADALGMLLANCACTARGILETTLDVSRGLFLLGGGAEVLQQPFSLCHDPCPCPFLCRSLCSFFLISCRVSGWTAWARRTWWNYALRFRWNRRGTFFEALDPSSSSFLFSRFLLREALSGGRALNPLPKLQLFCLLMEHQSCPK